MGDDFEVNPLLALNSAEEEVQTMVKKDFFPKLEWMTNLKKLKLTKYGFFGTSQDISSIRSLLLDDLCAFVFSEERAPSSLQCVWVEDFQLRTSLFPFWRNSPSKKSYYDSGHTDIDLSEYGNYQMVLQDENIEHMGEVEVLPSLNQRGANPQPYLPNLKYFRVSAHEEEDQQVCLAFLCHGFHWVLHFHHYLLSSFNINIFSKEAERLHS